MPDTSHERLFSLREAIRYVSTHKVPGDVVECGVWKGGSMMAAALTLIECGDVRQLHLFDTFTGMPPAEDVDVDHQDEPASKLLSESSDDSHIWARGPLEIVR